MKLSYYAISMTMTALVVVAVLAPNSTAIDVWKKDLSVRELAKTLSNSGQPFEADEKSSNRLVHIFARRQEPETIAKMVARTLGLDLRKSGTGWRFESNEAYDAMLRDHDKNRAGALVEAMANVFIGVEGTSGRNRNDVDAMLAAMSSQERKDLLRGYVVVGASPRRPGCVAYQGSPDQSNERRGIKQTFLLLRLDSKRGSLNSSYIYLPRKELWNGVILNERVLLNDGGGAILAANSEWSQVASWIKNWVRSPVTAIDQSFGASFQYEQQDQGSIAEHCAKLVTSPMVFEAYPKGIRLGFSIVDQIAPYIRQQDEWLLVKPREFWKLQAQISLELRIAALGAPPIGDQNKTFEWIARAKPDEVEDPYGERTTNEHFWSLWATLTPSQKSQVMNNGLSSSSLDRSQQRFLREAMLELAAHSQSYGDVSALLAGGPASLQIMRSNFWSLYRKLSNGSTAHSYRSKEKMLEQLPHAQGWTPLVGHFYNIRIKDAFGYVDTASKAAIQFRG